MRNRLIKLADQLSSSYWFVPGVMALFAILLSFITVQLDKTLGQDLTWVIRLIYVDSPDSARAVLSTIGSSMITVAGVVFSLTMVVLSLTSQQYGPLLLYYFMRDRGNQFVLGIFTSTFIYSLLILRTIRGIDENVFVPHISILVSLGLAIASLAFLIYYIHHVAESIQSTNIITRVGDNLLEGVKHLFPDKLGHEIEHPERVDERADDPVDVADESANLQDITRRMEKQGLLVKAKQSGYLQMIDDEKLFQIACAHDVIVQVYRKPGYFLVKGGPLVRVLPMRPAESENTHEPASLEHIAEEVAEAFVMGNRRTQNQDIEFLFTQLVSIAVRALSPGINDPYTAIMCLDRLSEALCEVLQRSGPSAYRYDEARQLRVIAHSIQFETLFHTAFDQIRHYGCSDLRLAMHLLKSVGVVSTRADDTAFVPVFQQYLDVVYQETLAQFTQTIDRRHLHRAYADAQHQLGQVTKT